MFFFSFYPINVENSSCFGDLQQSFAALHDYTKQSHYGVTDDFLVTANSVHMDMIEKASALFSKTKCSLRFVVLRG